MKDHLKRTFVRKGLLKSQENEQGFESKTHTSFTGKHLRWSLFLLTF